MDLFLLIYYITLKMGLKSFNYFKIFLTVL